MHEIFSVENPGDTVDKKPAGVATGLTIGLAIDQVTDQSIGRTMGLTDKTMLLREQLGDSLRSVCQLRPPEGLPTGIDAFDDFLLWRGLPKGDLSLFLGKPGTGATSLWLGASAQIHKKQKWVAWVNSEWDLTPNALLAKDLRLDRLLVVRKPSDNRQLFWILQELVSSSLFEMVGCHLPESLLKNHQLHKLKKIARLHQVALVLISHARNWSINPVFGLIIECGREFFTVKRALHRPTPFSVSGHLIHSNMGIYAYTLYPPALP